MYDSRETNGFHAEQDPSFGPLTMVGNGGRFVELFAGVAPGIGLLDREGVIKMLKSTLACIIRC